MSDNLDFIQDAKQLAQSLEKQTTTSWLSDFRKQQLALFSEKPWPSRKTEHFKYNNLTSLVKESFNQSVDKTTTIDSLDQAAKLSELNADTLVFIDGHYSKQHSSIQENKITFYSEANDEQQEFIINQLGQANSAKNLFSLLNCGLTQDGVLLEFNKQSSEKPVHIIHIGSAAAENKTVASNLIVKLDELAEATVIEQFLSHDNNATTALYNQMTQCVIGNGAKLNHYRLHLEEEHTIHMGQLDFWLNRDSQLNSFHVGLGGKIKRLDINVYHQQSGSHADLNGIYLAKNNQQVDYHTNVEHRVPNCTSQEVFRGLIGGSAKAVFNGRIHIYQDAQKTLAELSNKNLLLSNKAEINTKPELEIYADDVRCAHGATVAQMDETALFYLLSRGIPKHKAELMLSFGFINELLGNLKHASVADYLRPILAKLFEQSV